MSSFFQMSDSNSSSEKQLVHNFTCIIHPTFNIVYFLSSRKGNDVFKCEQCLTENPNLAAKVILIEEFLKQNDKVTKNWCI